jgi:uncharacterized membrane protein YphA (DoxX/SURF4 family)
MGIAAAATQQLLPLIARLFLCAAFLPMGWQKTFGISTYSGRDAQVLRAAGVRSDGLDWNLAKPGTVLAPESQDGAPFEARSLYKVSLRCAESGMPSPAILGWATALAELCGAVMMGLGFFARLAGFALAVVMGVAFWMTSVSSLGWSMPMEDYLRTWTQAGLLFMSVTVLLAGAGRLSLDAVLGGLPKPGRSASGGRKPKPKQAEE